MTGIPSIVAGLFGLALFIAFLPEGEQGVRMGIMGSVALSLLMIPTVVRSSEEMLRLVPMDLREADRKSTRLNSSHVAISYAVFCLKKKHEQIANKTQS